MRFIDLEEIEPAIRAQIPALAAAQKAINRESDPVARRLLIKNARGLWTALRCAFEAASENKCWYIECRNPGTDDDIDHFRPKLRVSEAPSHPGYYWLVLDWRNFRLSCHHANRPRTDEQTGLVGGKADHFPLLDEADRAASPANDYRLERPALLDPTSPMDPQMIYFAPDGDCCLAPHLRQQDVPERRFVASLRGLHLNWPRFAEARAELYNEIARLVQRGENAAPVDATAPATEAFVNIIRDLRRRLKPSAEYSSAARCYVELFRFHWWVPQLVLHNI